MPPNRKKTPPNPALPKHRERRDKKREVDGFDYHYEDSGHTCSHGRDEDEGYKSHTKTKEGIILR